MDSRFVLTIGTFFDKCRAAKSIGALGRRGDHGAGQRQLSDSWTYTGENLLKR